LQGPPEPPAQPLTTQDSATSEDDPTVALLVDARNRFNE